MNDTQAPGTRTGTETTERPGRTRTLLGFTAQLGVDLRVALDVRPR